MSGLPGLRLAVSVLCMFCGIVPFSLASPLKSDEEVMFMRDIARELDDGSVEANIRAWVFELEPRRGMTSLFASVLGVKLEELTTEEREIFLNRARYFKTDSERRKNLFIRLGERVEEMPRTDPAGRTDGRFVVGRGQVDAAGKVVFSIDRPGGVQHGVQGVALFVPTEGISVVSDIDDTVKISDVHDRKTLLRNTFLKPFEAVPGMARWYAEMADEGASFHYLSSSPIQLYPWLDAFLREQGFPEGSMHLRESTAWRTAIPGKKDSRMHKTATLERLFTALPQRRFILIGDSGEQDPEIYAEFARRYPERVEAIHIRDVSGEDAAAARYQKTFEGIPAERWHIFRDRDES